MTILDELIERIKFAMRITLRVDAAYYNKGISVVVAGYYVNDFLNIEFSPEDEYQLLALDDGTSELSHNDNVMRNLTFKQVNLIYSSLEDKLGKTIEELTLGRCNYL